MTKYETAERMQQKWEGGGQGRDRGGEGAGGRGVGRNFRAAGRRIRWRVPELTPNTPGPAASGGFVKARRFPEHIQIVRRYSGSRNDMLHSILISFIFRYSESGIEKL